MSVLAALFGAGGIVLLLGPGLVFFVLLGPAVRRRLDAAEALFLTVAVSIIGSTWVALLLSEIGRFSLPDTVWIVAVVSASALFLGRKRFAWPLRPQRLGVAALPVLLVSLAYQGQPGESVIGGRDPGVYLAAMGLIARTGGVAYEDPLVTALPLASRALFFSTPGTPGEVTERFQGVYLDIETGRATPTFFPLFPAFGALLFSLFGVPGALGAASMAGVLGTMAVFFAVRRTLGPAAAIGAGLLLAVNVLQTWFARGAYSEPLSQMLLFLGVYALALWEETRSRALAALAGAALGASLLCRVDNVLVLVPVALLLCARRESAREVLAFLVPFVALAGHALAHGLFIARPYLDAVVGRPYWIVLILWTVPVFAVALATVTWGARPARGWLHPGTKLRAAAAVTLVLAAAYAYFLRPALVALTSASWFADPGLALHDAASLVRLGWFVSPLALALSVGGLAVAMWKGPRGAFFLVTLALTFTWFYSYKARVSDDCFFAMRRFVPVVLPATLAFASWALVRLGNGGWPRRLPALTTFVAIAGTSIAQTQPVAAHREWAGSAPFVAAMAAELRPDDVLIVEPRGSLHLLALPLWGLHGRNVLELRSFEPDPAALEDLATHWGDRRVFLAWTDRLALCCPDLRDRRTRVLRASEWESTVDRPPVRAEKREMRVQIAQLVPRRNAETRVSESAQTPSPQKSGVILTPRSLERSAPR